MNPAKIHLSPEELALVQNAELLLTKNRIIGKVYDLFGEMAAVLSELLNERKDKFPPAVLLASPKIARGENYKGLPYVMLDYPRCFGKEDVFAIRTFFWWGNFFSITLHLKGIYQQNFEPVLNKHRAALEEAGFRLTLSEDEWDHDLATAIRIMPGAASGDGNGGNSSHRAFYKLAARLELSEWNEMKIIIPRLYGTLCQAVAD